MFCKSSTEKKNNFTRALCVLFKKSLIYLRRPHFNSLVFFKLFQFYRLLLNMEKSSIHYRFGWRQKCHSSISLWLEHVAQENLLSWGPLPPPYQIVIISKIFTEYVLNQAEKILQQHRYGITNMTALNCNYWSKVIIKNRNAYSKTKYVKLCTNMAQRLAIWDDIKFPWIYFTTIKSC